MLRRVSIEGVKLDRLYLADTHADFKRALDNGLPVVKWKGSMEDFIVVLLRPTLEKKFPGIDWDKVLGKKRRFRSIVYYPQGYDEDGAGETALYDAEAMLDSQLAYDKKVNLLDHSYGKDDHRMVDIAQSSRACIADRSADGYDSAKPDFMELHQFVGDLSSKVDVDALMKLGLLPQFIGDIVDCIRTNLSTSMRWTEGYTKKLGYPLGKTNRNKQLPNLIIIDCSHSIPDGIAATMLAIADTLREKCNADLIITSARSGYYPAGCELPSPQALRDYYGRSNESAEFFAILDKYIAGREWGHVFSFGDYDHPGDIDGTRDWQTGKTVSAKMTGTKVHAVHHFHTFAMDRTGYASWVRKVCPTADETFNTEWCEVMNNGYRM